MWLKREGDDGKKAISQPDFSLIELLIFVQIFY